MPKRRKNWVEFTGFNDENQQRGTMSLVEAKALFLQEIRGLAEQTRRWHKENLNALIKVLGMQGIGIPDVNQLSA